MTNIFKTFQPTRERISRIKEARFVYHGEEAQRSTVFNDGNLHLYKVIPPIPLRALTVNFFEIGDNLETKEVFRMSISSTIVTKDRIMISFIARTITLILNENDSRATFALYQRLFPLGTFSVSISNPSTNKISSNYFLRLYVFSFSPTFT